MSSKYRMTSQFNHRSSAVRAVYAMAIVCFVAVFAATSAVGQEDPMSFRGKHYADNSKRYSAEEQWANSAPGGVGPEVLYLVHCSRCHRPDGLGSRDLFPPLAKSDLIAANPEVIIPIALQGMSGDITVNGLSYYGQAMPQIDYLTDRELASVLTWVLNQWNNPGGEITAKKVAEYRKAAGFEPHP